MAKSIIVTGASGLIGTLLVDALLKRGDNVISLTTNYAASKGKLPASVRIFEWNNFLTLANENVDAVVNLAGRNLGDKRWSKKIKKEIYDSRIQSTRKIVDLIRKMNNKPEVLINASGVDYYGNRGDEVITEDSAPGFDFLSGVCIDWEREAYNAEDFGVRVVIIRNGFVMAKNSPALRRLTFPFRLYCGGTIGSGRQYMSWIHIADLVNIYLLAMDNRNLSGSLNATAPNPVTMKEFCRNIGHVLHRPSFFQVPPFIVKIAAGETSQVVLNGRKAIPDKLNRLGFRFKYPMSLEALGEVLA